MDEYKRRWEIEVLFQYLKSRGFNFAETHLKDEEHLKSLFAVLAIAFCWAYHVGAWRHVVKPIRIKKHARPARSIFVSDHRGSNSQALDFEGVDIYPIFTVKIENPEKSNT